jgi:hypothetical protein
MGNILRCDAVRTDALNSRRLHVDFQEDLNGWHVSRVNHHGLRISGLLFGLSSVDPLTFAAMAATLGAITP